MGPRARGAENANFRIASRRNRVHARAPTALAAAASPGEKFVRNSVLDRNEVAEVEALVEFVGVCRYFASELATNKMTQRALSELRRYLDSGTRAAA